MRGSSRQHDAEAEQVDKHTRNTINNAARFVVAWTCGASATGAVAADVVVSFIANFLLLAFPGNSDSISFLAALRPDRPSFIDSGTHALMMNHRPAITRNHAMTPATTTKPQTCADPAPEPAYLIFDAESVPDGRLLAAVKFPGENLTPEEAVRRYQEELRKQSPTGSDFVPVPLQYPVAICVVRVGADYTLQSITRLDEPHFKPRQIVEQFWGGLCKIRERYRERVKAGHLQRPRLRSAAFGNGGLPLRLRLAPRLFRHHPQALRVNPHRRHGIHGQLWRRAQAASPRICSPSCSASRAKCRWTVTAFTRCTWTKNSRPSTNYCMFDTLDLYFIFLRTRVMMGLMTLGRRTPAGAARQGVFADASGAMAGAGSIPGELGRLESLAIVVGTLRVP